MVGVAAANEAWIQTFSGIRFTPLAPHVDQIEIRDIAHALAHQCRFAGHTAEFYSVAEHSVRVSVYLGSLGHPPGVQLQGLLHDASEAYLSDVVSPVKRHMVDYRIAERELMNVIYTRFALPTTEHAAVKGADEVLLATEARDLLAGGPRSDFQFRAAPLTERIRPWGPPLARSAFLDRYNALLNWMGR